MKQKKFTLTKFQGITLFTVAMLIMAAVIVFYRNPLADPAEETMKKAIACVLILSSILVFAKWYDKFTVLPVELFQSRHLIWKLAKNDFKKRYSKRNRARFVWRCPGPDEEFHSGRGRESQSEVRQ